MAIEKQTSKKYAKISEKRRNALIDLVNAKNFSIPKASKLLKLNVSTAKNIIKIYNREGRVMNKRMSKKQRTFPEKQVTVPEPTEQSVIKSQSGKKESESMQINSPEPNINSYFPQFYMVPVFYCGGFGGFEHNFSFC